MSETTSSEAHFDIDLRPGDALLPDSGRFDFTKTWGGAMVGTGHGVMLSAGDPATGAAGYVALERFEGSLDGRTGGFALQQSGTMSNAGAEMSYLIVPGSGTDDLTGIAGAIELITDTGTHQVRIDYRLD